MAVCSLQSALFVILVSLSLFNETLGIPRDTGEPFFKAIGVAFVALSPFGILSLFLTVGFNFMWRHDLFSTNQKRALSNGNPVLFFVWDEALANIGRLQ